MDRCMGPNTTKVFGSDINLVLFRRECGLAEWFALMLKKNIVWPFALNNENRFSRKSCKTLDKSLVWYSCQLRNGQSANAVSF